MEMTHYSRPPRLLKHSGPALTTIPLVSGTFRLVIYAFFLRLFKRLLSPPGSHRYRPRWLFVFSLPDRPVALPSRTDPPAFQLSSVILPRIRRYFLFNYASANPPVSLVDFRFPHLVPPPEPITSFIDPPS